MQLTQYMEEEALDPSISSFFKQQALQTTNTESICSWLNSFINIALVFSLYVNYDLYLRWSQISGSCSPFDNLKNTGMWKKLVVEITINMLSPYQMLKGIKYLEKHPDVTLEYEINELLLCFSFIRLYLPIILYLYSTEFINPRTHRVCKSYGCQASSLFAIKCLV